MKRFLYILPLLLFACSGNKQQFASEEELQSYINDPDNGYIVSTETNDMLVEAKLTPPVDNESGTTIQLRINRKDGGSVLDFGGATKAQALEKEGYLSFDLMGDVYLENGGKIIPCSFHHYERNYGLKPSIDLLFQFNGFKPEEDVFFIYRDQLFNQGLIKLKFSKESFNTCHVQ